MHPKLQLCFEWLVDFISNTDDKSWTTLYGHLYKRSTLGEALGHYEALDKLDSLLSLSARSLAELHAADVQC